MGDYDYLRGGYKVGEYGFAAVGIGGTVTDFGKGWVEINNQRLPLNLEPGADVRWISMVPPDEVAGVRPSASSASCADCDEMQRQMDRESERLVDLVRAKHDEDHAEAWVLCNDSLCREFQGALT